jgi:hypothetical protein
MAPGDRYVEAFRARKGPTFKVEVLTVEPVLDVAVLGPGEDDAFNDFCAATRPVRICTADFPLFDPFPVHILAHHGRWVPAQARQCHVNAPIALYVSQRRASLAGPLEDQSSRKTGS